MLFVGIRVIMWSMVKKIISEQFDVLVIGGGPAGLMAAGKAAQKGARVALVEKNDRYGIKLLMTGNGRCNVTQDADNMREFSKVFKNGKFLLSAFGVFGPRNARAFLKKRGVETKVEKNGKVFPKSDQSKDILEALYQYCRENGVTFFNTEEVVDIVAVGNVIEKVVTKKKEISANRYILATGGKSYPHTGSSGQGFVWAKKIGHTVVEPAPALVPIMIEQRWVKDAQGLSAHGVELLVLQDNKKIAKEAGDILFTHFGLSGPLTLNLSRAIARVIPDSIRNPNIDPEINSGRHGYMSVQDDKRIKLAVDFKPELSFQQLDEILQNDFAKNASKNLENCLKDFASPKLLELILNLSGVDVKKHAANISKQDRQKITNLFKKMEMTVEGLFGYEKAMITSGGVATKEIDSQTMQSKIIPNLFFAGEIIDVDGPTGGYNLQICWSTGFVAGENAAKLAF